MSKNKMSKDVVPEDFTLSLVLVDAIPVLFFGISMVMLGLLFSSQLFILGAMLCFYAGAAKVLWKLIVVLRKKNIWWLFVQMRYVMPIGFLLMFLAVIIHRGSIDISTMFAAILSFPSVIFFAIGIIGMGMMMYFGFHLDSSEVKANWIEQITNGIAQVSFFLGLLLLYMK